MPLKKVRIGSKANAIYPIHYYRILLVYKHKLTNADDGNGTPFCTRWLIHVDFARHSDDSTNPAVL